MRIDYTSRRSWDSSADVLVYNNLEHALLHDGRIRSLTGSVTLAANGIFMLLIRVPAEKHMHFRHTVRVQGEAVVTIWEGPTVTDVGTKVTEINRNRPDAANVSGTLLYTGPTVSALGTSLDEEHVGNGVNGGDIFSSLDEFEFNSGDHILRVLSDVNGNEISWRIVYYYLGKPTFV